MITGPGMLWFDDDKKRDTVEKVDAQRNTIRASTALSRPPAM